MFHKLALTLMLLLLSTLAFADEKITDQDKMILRLALKAPYPDGGFTVGSPQTSIGFTFSDRPEADIKKGKQFLYEKLGASGEVLRNLVDSLFKRNRASVRLSIDSSVRDGYFVDHKEQYLKYFAKDGGGWERWYEEHPKAHGRTTVSLPVHDKESGLVLLYKGTQSHWLAGVGYVILYKYQNDELKELNKVMLWIS